MSQQKYIIGTFLDEEPLLDAVKEVRATGTPIHECYTPFPVHGLDEALGYSRSRLPRAAFMFGVLGFSLGLSMQAWMLGFDWPMNIGGKPALAWPDFVPVTFELTVLITALGMVGTYLVACGFIPGSEPKMPDPGVTSNKFCIAIPSNTADFDKINGLLQRHGADSVVEKEVEL